MFVNRLFAVFVVLSLVLVGAFTYRSAVATPAVVSGDHSYDEIEHIRGMAPQPVVEDRSYDEIEHIRADRDSQQIEDHRYDAIERIRSTSGTLNDDPMDVGTLLAFQHFRASVSGDDPLDVGTLLAFRHFRTTVSTADNPMDVGTLLEFRRYRMLLPGN